MTVSLETTMLPESELSIRSLRGTTTMSINYSSKYKLEIILLIVYIFIVIMRTLKTTELNTSEMVMMTIFLMVEWQLEKSILMKISITIRMKLMITPRMRSRERI